MNTRFAESITVIMSIFAFTIASGEEENQTLRIESQTALASAQFYISGGDEEEDKKRTTIGIGETVTLTLTGKGIKDDTEVEWEIEGEGASVEGQGASATLTADSIMKDSSVTVKAKVNEDTATINFEIKKPTGLKGEKNGYTLPNQPSIVGLTGTIVVTVEPVNVNFSQVPIFELDGGKVVEESFPIPFGDHDCGTNRNPPNVKNQFEDQVFIEFDVTRILFWNGTSSAKWICHFHSINDQEENRIQTEDQVFTISRKYVINLPPIDTLTLAISKFGINFSHTYDFNE